MTKTYWQQPASFSYEQVPLLCSKVYKKHRVLKTVPKEIANNIKIYRPGDARQNYKFGMHQFSWPFAIGCYRDIKPFRRPIRRAILDFFFESTIQELCGLATLVKYSFGWILNYLCKGCFHYYNYYEKSICCKAQTADKV